MNDLKYELTICPSLATNVANLSCASLARVEWVGFFVSCSLSL